MKKKAAVVKGKHYLKKMQQHRGWEGTARCLLRVNLSSASRVNPTSVLSYSETSPGEIALGLWKHQKHVSLVESFYSTWYLDFLPVISHRKKEEVTL